MGSSSSTLLKIPNVEELVQETGCELTLQLCFSYYLRLVIVALERLS